MRRQCNPIGNGCQLKNLYETENSNQGFNPLDIEGSLLNAVWYFHEIGGWKADRKVGLRGERFLA